LTNTSTFLPGSCHKAGTDGTFPVAQPGERLRHPEVNPA
jgi:hypothetical protein